MQSRNGQQVYIRALLFRFFSSNAERLSCRIRQAAVQELHGQSFVPNSGPWWSRSGPWGQRRELWEDDKLELSQFRRVCLMGWYLPLDKTRKLSIGTLICFD